MNIVGQWGRLARWSMLGLLLCSVSAYAQRNLNLEAATLPASEQRLALVIGNATYKDAPLKNPVNNASDMARTLRELGWKVSLKSNVTQRQMKEAIREFGVDLARGGVGLFYFAGHGLQYRGENYLVPVGAEIGREAHIEDEAVSARFVLTQLEEARNRTNIVILDACRNNPFSRGFRSVSSGLAQMDAAQGTLIAFATAPGSVAADGNGRNGVYTKHLLQQLKIPGVPVELMLKRVRNGVMNETREKQTPWESSSLRGADFYFRPAAVGGVGEAAAPLVPTALADPVTVELAFWDSIKESRSADEIRLYLDQYPQGQFAALAKVRMQSLSSAAIPAALAAPSGQSGPPATVYLYRKSQFMGSINDYSITNKGRMIGMLSSGSYLIHKTPPGELVLTAEGAASVSRTYDVESGKTYYMEFTSGFTSVNLRMVDDKEGIAAISDLKQK